MTSSNGNIFRFTGHLCGEFTGHMWIRPLWRHSKEYTRFRFRMLQPTGQVSISNLAVSRPHGLLRCVGLTVGCVESTVDGNNFRPNTQVFIRCRDIHCDVAVNRLGFKSSEYLIVLLIYDFLKHFLTDYAIIKNSKSKDFEQSQTRCVHFTLFLSTSFHSGPNHLLFIPIATPLKIKSR